MKALRPVVASALSALALFALSLAPAPSHAASNTVTYAMYGDIKDWDPAVAFSLEVMMLVNVYEPLLWYNPPGSEKQFTPALAESWSVSDDGLTWTFKLREGVSFHDGEPFNAAAAKASIERTRELKQGAYYIWAGVESIEAPDDVTLVIRTGEPQPIDLIASSQYGAYMYSPKAAAQGTEWFNQGNAAGTGPYTVRQWVQGQQLVLEKNPGYWGGWTDANFDRVILKVVTENSTQVQMLKSGEADFISLVPADIVDSLDNEDGISAHAIASWKNSQFLINTQKSPTDNVSFRRALTHLWDYESVVNDIYAGFASVGRGAVPATMWGHDDSIEAPAFDPELARRLLEESGIPESDWKVTMAYIGTSEAYKNAALLFQENARQVGVEVELLPGEWGVIWDRAKNLDTAPNLQSMTWWPTYPTPSDWLIGLFRTEEKTLFNLSHYANPEYDEVLDNAVSLEGSDRDKAIELYGEAQRILMNDAVAIFYADIETRVARRSDIRGLDVNPAYNAVFFHRISRD
ncbi:MAG: ABC transporter substrate-binding protein [Proteobacteria bacterium]|nr:MAG: ABC transporter substrate-binding protein [Pseudomonadota bacterium]